MTEATGRYAGKTVLITQADDALSEALARRYAAEGAKLVLAGMRDGDEWVARRGAAKDENLTPAGKCDWDEERVLRVKSDLTSFDGAQALLERALDKFGGIDAAAIYSDVVRRCSIEDAAPAFIKRQMDENCRPYFTLTRALGEHMAMRGTGRIVYVSSIHGDKPTGCAFAYAMAKGALNMLCKEAALWLGRAGCAVNLIQAGSLEGDEERFENELSGYHYRQNIKIPRRRCGTPDEIAPVCAFLTSDEAAFVNGAILKVDGGQILHYRYRT